MIDTNGYIKFHCIPCYDDSREHRKLYGVVNPEEIKKNYYPFCYLKEAIASFYLLELERFERKKRFWTDKYDDYYTKEVTRKALIVLRFTIAAAVGEARHFKNRGKMSTVGISKTEKREYERNFKQAKQYLALLMGGFGYSQIPMSRTIIYRSYVPESSWLTYLFATYFIFNKVRWTAGFGGKKWGKGCEHALRLYKSLCGGSFSDIAICFDTLINHFHNGGLLLNKFDCFKVMSLHSLLDEKQKGDFTKISGLLRNSPCGRWADNCSYVLRCQPIKQSGGINGKKKKQKEGQGWWISSEDSEFVGEKSEEEKEDGCGDPECPICYPEG